jgi:hypothetical protein
MINSARLTVVPRVVPLTRLLILIARQLNL